MDIKTILEITKERLGIRTDIRDTYITSIIKGLMTELEQEKGLKLDIENPYHASFISDFAVWRYQSKDFVGNITKDLTFTMPRHLQYRLHNFIIHQQAGGGEDGDI